MIVPAWRGKSRDKHVAIAEPHACWHETMTALSLARVAEGPEADFFVHALLALAAL
jgi:hypothetical protein